MIPPKYWSPTKKLMVLGAMAGGKTVEATATGNPLVFFTDLARPLKSLLIPFTPQQEGTGNPSPENVRPIVPWNGLKVFGGGKNLLDISTVVKGTLDGTGALVENNNRRTSAYITLGAGKYKISRKTLVDWWKAWSYKLDGTPISKLFDGNGYEVTLTLTEMCMIRISFDYVVTDENEVQLEAGQTATAYEPYKPITETDIVFPSPVYGGTLDVVSGVLTREWAALSIATLPREHWVKSSSYPGGFYINVSAVNPSFKIHTPFMCSHGKTVSNISEYANGTVFCDSSLNFRFMDESATLPDWYSYMDGQVQAGTPIIACYQLAEAQEIQLTAQQLAALVGDNTIWSDADGQMTAVYLKKG